MIAAAQPEAGSVFLVFIALVVVVILLMGGKKK